MKITSLVAVLREVPKLTFGGSLDAGFLLGIGGGILFGCLVCVIKSSVQYEA